MQQFGLGCREIGLAGRPLLQAGTSSVGTVSFDPPFLLFGFVCVCVCVRFLGFELRVCTCKEALYHLCLQLHFSSLSFICKMRSGVRRLPALLLRTPIFRAWITIEEGRGYTGGLP
jgi:hypothetical protein